LLALYTIFTCAALTFESGALPAGFRYPPISLFGVHPPAAVALYKTGFPLVALLFFLAVFPISRFLREHAVGEEEKNAAWTCSWTAVAAFAGLGVHGFVPLHASILKQVRGERATAEEAAGANVQNGVHQAAAAAFFMLSIYHGVTVVKLLYGSGTHPMGLRGQSPLLSSVSVGLKGLTLGLQFLPSLVGLVGHPVMNAVTGLSLNENDIGGASQWWTVGCLICFYVTYSVDLVVMALHQQRGGGEVIGEKKKKK
jgi:hypothetical protein